MKRLIPVLCALGFLAACGKDPEPAAAPSPARVATPSLDAAVLARLGDAAAFETAAAKPYAALACARGEVEELDVLVCHYADEAAADAATPSLREFVAGALSGLVRKAGFDVIAIADRKEADPKGERISRLAAAFVTPP